MVVYYVSHYVAIGFIRKVQRDSLVARQVCFNLGPQFSYYFFPVCQGLRSTLDLLDYSKIIVSMFFRDQQVVSIFMHYFTIVDLHLFNSPIREPKESGPKGPFLLAVSFPKVV